MEDEKLNDAGFLSFCELVKQELGEASTEVLYAWYYNTFKKTNKKSNESESK